MIGGQDVSWNEALGKAEQLILDGIKRHGHKAIGVLIAPTASNEDAWTATRLFRETLKLVNLDYEILSSEKLKADHLLLTDDPYPNRRGFSDLGVGPATDGLTAPQIIQAIKEGRVKGLILAGTDRKGVFGEEALAILDKLDWLIMVNHLAEGIYQKATVALPMAVFAERPGTFTNVNGLVQKFEKALEPLGQSRPQWLIWQDLAQRLGAKWHYDDERAVFKDLSQNKPAYNTLNWHSTFGVKPAFNHDDWYNW